jgi:hypothetical protein
MNNIQGSTHSHLARVTGAIRFTPRLLSASPLPALCTAPKSADPQHKCCWPSTAAPSRQGIRLAPPETLFFQEYSA